MELQPPAEQDKNRSDSTARRENEGFPGLWYLFFGRRKEVRRNEDNQESYFLDHYSSRVFAINSTEFDRRHAYSIFDPQRCS